MARQALALYGPEKGKAWVLANIPGDVQQALFIRGAPKNSAADKGVKGVQSISRFAPTTGNLVDKTARLFGLTHGKKPGATNDLDAMAATAGPGALDQMSELGEQQIGTQAAQANAMEGLVASSRGYGNAMRAQINRDAERQLAQVQAATQAQARASGTSGSSYSSGQQASNAARIFEAKTDALTNVDTGEQNRTLGLRQNVIGQNLSNAASATALRMNPIQTNLSFLQGSAFNPYVPGQYPGVSPIGNAANSIGNTSTGYGGMVLGQRNAMDLAGAIYGNGNQGYNPGAYNGGQMDQMLNAGGGSTSGSATR